MFRNQSVDVHRFAMVPRTEVPRSSFMMQHTHKTTFDAGYLIPVYVDEVLPGDSFSLQMTAFARMATPLFPLMDNMRLDSFSFLFLIVLSGLIGRSFKVRKLILVIRSLIRFLRLSRPLVVFLLGLFGIILDFLLSDKSVVVTLSALVRSILALII